eukprot:gene6182-biopygen27157
MAPRILTFIHGFKFYVHSDCGGDYRPDAGGDLRECQPPGVPPRHLRRRPRLPSGLPSTCTRHGEIGASPIRKFFVLGGFSGTSRALSLVRWVSHCALGTILRLHGDNHKPWSYDNATEDAVRRYLKMRYGELLPSLISAGEEATRAAAPIVARWLRADSAGAGIRPQS